MTSCILILSISGSGRHPACLYYQHLEVDNTLPIYIINTWKWTTPCLSILSTPGSGRHPACLYYQHLEVDDTLPIYIINTWKWITPCLSILSTFGSGQHPASLYYQHLEVDNTLQNGVHCQVLILMAGCYPLSGTAAIMTCATPIHNLSYLVTTLVHDTTEASKRSVVCNQNIPFPSLLVLQTLSGK